MSKLSDLKKELRDLRKKHCPPTGKMKKDDVMKEIQRLSGVEKVTEYEAPAPKPRVKKPKKEMKEMSIQADMDEEEEEGRREAMAKRMAEVRARRKIAGAVTKAVEAKKEKKATEEKVETMKKKVAGRKVAEAVKKMVEGKKAKKDEEEKPKKRKLRATKEQKVEMKEYKHDEDEDKKARWEKIKALVDKGEDIEKAVDMVDKEEKPVTKKKQKSDESAETVQLDPKKPSSENVSMLRDLAKKGILYMESQTGQRAQLEGFSERVYYVRKGDTLIKIGKASVSSERGRNEQYEFQQVRQKSYPMSSKTEANKIDKIK